jgi:hypothetical protein
VRSEELKVSEQGCSYSMWDVKALVEGGGGRGVTASDGTRFLCLCRLATVWCLNVSTTNHGRDQKRRKKGPVVEIASKPKDISDKAK